MCNRVAETFLYDQSTQLVGGDARRTHQLAILYMSIRPLRETILSDGRGYDSYVVGMCPVFLLLIAVALIDSELVHDVRPVQSMIAASKRISE